jgi:hypothetical protein
MGVAGPDPLEQLKEALRLIQLAQTMKGVLHDNRTSIHQMVGPAGRVTLPNAPRVVTAGEAPVRSRGWAPPRDNGPTRTEQRIIDQMIDRQDALDAIDAREKAARLDVARRR